MDSSIERYTHGHHESVLRSHQWRTAENSAGYLINRLRSGLTVLDVGCGPGTITADFANLVAPGAVVGIDLSETVIEIARRQSAPRQLANLSFETDDVYQLSLSDETFDVVHAHQVLQHLGDPVAALIQMRRVLRSGGLLAVRDADYGAFAWYPTSAGLDRWMVIYHELTRLNRAEADAGRHLAAWVREAGFDGLEVSSTNWTYHDVDERCWWGQLWAERVLHSGFAQQCLEAGIASQGELEQISRAFLDWTMQDNAVFIVPSVEVLARR
ncbi:MAG: methyltransferase domain-containing protein [Acidimicrobiaceae bacterium]|nr:methyltransferase domain-containing protein [Acidimicrobiaceae bacterium]